MSKEIMKSLCSLMVTAYKEGCISISCCSNKSIHLTEKAFREMFDSWEVTKHDEELDRWYVIEDGFEFFCLVEF